MSRQEDKIEDLSREELIDLLKILLREADEANRSHREMMQDLHLTEKELTETQNQVLQASKLSEVGTMTAGIIHELKNPLTVVLGLSHKAKMLLGENSKAYDTLSKIEIAGNKMREIIDHLVVFVRNSSEEELVSIDLNQIISSSIEFLSYELKKNSITYELTLPSVQTKVSGNSIQIESVLQNLISNSIDAFGGINDRRKKLIKITVTRKEGSTTLEYTDNACGIPEAILPSLFEPFVTSKEAGKGTGLGMAIVKNILDRHDATIEAQTVAEKGTKFLIDFPSG